MFHFQDTLLWMCSGQNLDYRKVLNIARTPNIPLAAKNTVRPAKGIKIMLEHLVTHRFNMISIPFAGLTIILAAKGILGVCTIFGTLWYYVLE